MGPTAEPEPVPPLLYAELASVPEDAQAPAQEPRRWSSTTDAAAVPPPLQASDPFTTLESVPAEPFATLDYEERTMQQKQTAKQLVKDFVKTMVKGRQFSAVLPSGQVRACFCALNRSLDKLQIRA